MRRGSLIAPLLLIMIGVVFLVRNIMPDWPLLDLLITWWPFILIGWGLIRLVELVFAYSSDKPLPRAGISGGEWALIIVLTLIGSTVWGVQRFTRDGLGRFRIGGVEVFGDSYDYPAYTLNGKTGKTPRIVIENGRGVTRVTAGETEEVSVTGKKTIRALNKSEADKANNAAGIEFSATPESVIINTRHEKAEEARITTDLDVTIPKGAIVEIRGRGADIDVNGIQGDVTVSSERGGVRVQDLGARLIVDSRSTDIVRAIRVKGDVELKGRGRDIEIEEIAGEVSITGAYSGETIMRKIEKAVRFNSNMTELRFEKVPGEISMSLSTLTCNNVTGPVLIKARSKDIVLTDASNTVTIDVERGDVELVQEKATSGRVDIEVRSGDIDLALPEKAKFTIAASTSRGEVHNDFSDKLEVKTEERGGRLAGTLGAGPEFKLQTNRGSVTVRKSGAAAGVEAPPKAPKPPAPAVPERASDQ